MLSPPAHFNDDGDPAEGPRRAHRSGCVASCDVWSAVSIDQEVRGGVLAVGVLCVCGAVSGANQFMDRGSGQGGVVVAGIVDACCDAIVSVRRRHWIQTDRSTAIEAAVGWAFRVQYQEVGPGDLVRAARRR